MKYDEEMLENMAEKINLVDYAANTCELRKSGANYYTLCFIHNEKTPSLCIFPKTNSWFCFGCGAGGGIYQWIMDWDKVSFGEAVQKVAELTNTGLESVVESENISFYKSLKQCDCTQKENIVRNILDFEKDYINKYADEIPDEWVNEGIEPEIMKKFNIRVDRSSNRIVYPLIDNDGNYIAAKGRTRLNSDLIKQLRIPKYIALGKIGTVNFFCGMRENAEGIKKHNKVIVFEGIKSVMKVIPWGYDCGVSSETSHLGEEQVKILIRLGVDEVIIAYDKGVKIQNIIPQVQLLKKFCKVSVMYDSNDLLQDKDSPCDKGKDVFQKLYDSRIFIS